MCNTWGNCIRNFKRGEIATTILVLSLVAMGIGSILGLRNMNILRGSAQSACQYESTAYLWDESGNVLTQLTEAAPFRLKTTFPNGEYTGGGEGERLLSGKLHKLVDLRDQDKDIMVQVQLTGIASNDDILYPACTEFNNFPTQAGNPRKGACREWGNDIVILQLKCGSRNEYGWVLKNSAIARIMGSIPTPTPFVCSGTNAWCQLPYTEKCGAGNSGSRTCYATQCSAQGGADKCQWGVGSCCSKCSDGSSDAATCPNGIAPIPPNSTPTTVPTAVPTAPAASTGTIDSVQITYNNGATYTVSRNNNSCTSAQRTQGTCPSGDCRISNDGGGQPNQVRIFKTNANFKVNKVMLYRGCPCNASGICDASKGGQAQQIRDDFCFGGNDAVDHINKMSCKFDGTQCNTTNDDSTPAPAGSCSGGTGGTNPQPTTPQQPANTCSGNGASCNKPYTESCGNNGTRTCYARVCNGAGGLEKCVWGGDSCCSRCSDGSTDANTCSNGGSPSGPQQPPQQPTAVPTQRPPSGQVCSAAGASCSDTYTEACGNGGSHVCHKSGTCDAAGNGTHCSWGAGSYCEDCSGGSTQPQQPTAIPTQRPPSGQVCSAAGASCSDTYTEACGNGGSHVCHKSGTCDAAGNGTHCSWGAGSYCEDCSGGSTQPAPTSPTTCPDGKKDTTGACNTACCSNSNECSNGLVCTGLNEYCRSGKMCTAGSPPSEPAPTTPPQQPANQCTGNGASCYKPYTETCNNGGTRTCYATVCNGVGNLDKCVWGPNSTCDECVGGTGPQPTEPSSNTGSIHIVINVDPAVKTAQPNANWLGYFIVTKETYQPVGGNNGDHIQPYGTGGLDENLSNLDPNIVYHIEPRLKYENGNGHDVTNIRMIAMQCGNQPGTQAHNYCNVIAGDRVSFYIQNDTAAPTPSAQEPTVAPTEAQATYVWKGYIDIPTILRINSLTAKWYEYVPNNPHNAGQLLGSAGVDQSGEFGQAPNGYVRYGIHINNLANKQIVPQISANYAYDPNHNYTFENCDSEGYCPVMDITQGIKGFTLFDLSRPHSLKMLLDVNLDLPIIRNLSFAVRVRQAIFSSQPPYKTMLGDEIGQGSVVQENGKYYAIVNLQGLQGNAFYVRPEISFDVGNKHFTLTPNDTENTPQGYYLAETNGSMVAIHIDIPFTVGVRRITFQADLSNSPLAWVLPFINDLNIKIKVWFSDNSTPYGEYKLEKSGNVLFAVVPRLGNALYYFQGSLSLHTPLHDLDLNTDLVCGGHCWIDLTNAPDLTQVPIKFVPPDAPFAPTSADINGDGYVNVQDFAVMMRRTVRVNSSQRYAVQASRIISNLGKKVVTENNSQELLNYLKNYKKKQ